MLIKKLINSFAATYFFKLLYTAELKVAECRITQVLKMHSAIVAENLATQSLKIY